MTVRLCKIVLSIGLALIFTGCASTPPQAIVINNPDPTNSMLYGQIAIPDTFFNGESRKLAYKKMRELCNGDYILDDEVYRVTIDTGVGQFTGTSLNRINHDGVKTKGLLFRCKQ